MATCAVLHRSHHACGIALDVKGLSESIAQAEQKQALTFERARRWVGSKDPPRTERVVGDEEKRWIAPVIDMQGGPRGVQAKGQCVFQRLQATAHDPQAFAAAESGFAWRQWLEADAAALRIVERQRIVGLQHRRFSGQPPTGTEQANGCGRIRLITGVVPRDHEGHGPGQSQIDFTGLYLGAQQRIDGIAFGRDAVGAGRAGDAARRADEHIARALGDGPALEGLVVSSGRWFAGHVDSLSLSFW